MIWMKSEALSLVIYALLGGLLLLLPYLVFPTVPFGVRVPMAYAHDPAVLTERRRYTLRLGAVVIVTLLVNLATWSLAGWDWLRHASILLLVVAGWLVYYLSHRRLGAVKVANHWYAHTRQVVAASASPRAMAPSRLIWVFLALAGGVIALTALIEAWRYPALPATLEFVFPEGLGKMSLATTPFNASLPAIFQLLFTAILAGLAWLRQTGGQPADVEDLAGAQRYQQFNVHIIQALLLLLALGFDCAFLVAGLAGWGLLPAGSSIMDVATLAPLLAWLAVAPILLLGLRREPSNSSGATATYVTRDDDRFWKLGMLYVNRDDPSLFVNKRFGIGRTLNFGHPLAWIILVAIAGLILFKLLSRS
jgi:uncharacterized membrane protein